MLLFSIYTTHTQQDIYCKFDLFTYENIKTDILPSSSSTKLVDVNFKKQITIDGYSTKVYHPYYFYKLKGGSRHKN